MFTSDRAEGYWCECFGYTVFYFKLFTVSAPSAVPIPVSAPSAVPIQWVQSDHYLWQFTCYKCLPYFTFNLPSMLSVNKSLQRIFFKDMTDSMHSGNWCHVKQSLRKLPVPNCLAYSHVLQVALTPLCKFSSCVCNLSLPGPLAALGCTLVHCSVFAH